MLRVVKPPDYRRVVRASIEASFWVPSEEIDAATVFRLTDPREAEVSHSSV
jgi:hypothetical protein